MTMRRFEAGRRGVLLTAPALLGLAGCNPTQVVEQRRYSGPPLRRPEQVIILDPGIQPSDVRLDQGVRERLLQATSDEPVSAQRTMAGRRAALAVADETVQRVQGFGLRATRQGQPPPPSPAPIVLVEGHMLAVDEGNSTRRRIVGLGAGASSVSVEVQVFYRDGNAPPRMIDSFVVTARSPRTPGAAGTMGAGAALSRAAEAAAASAVLQGVSEARSADTGVEGRRIGDASPRSSANFSSNSVGFPAARCSRRTPMNMLMSLLLLAATPAFAQPSPQAAAAVRASCRSDFLSYCQGVPRGGREALACLSRNMDRLTPACRDAVSTVERSLGAR